MDLFILYENVKFLVFAGILKYKTINDKMMHISKLTASVDYIYQLKCLDTTNLEITNHNCKKVPKNVEATIKITWL